MYVPPLVLAALFRPGPNVCRSHHLLACSLRCEQCLIPDVTLFWQACCASLLRKLASTLRPTLARSGWRPRLSTVGFYRSGLALPPRTRCRFPKRYCFALVVAPRDDLLTSRRAKRGGVLTGEGASPSVLTSLPSRRAAKAAPPPWLTTLWCRRRRRWSDP